MRCLRRILKIKWDDDRELNIKNIQVREKFKNIETIENIISKRRLMFIGKVIRMPCKCVPARLPSAFQRNKRPLGRPNITVRHSFINDIEKYFQMLIQPVLSTVGFILSSMKKDGQSDAPDACGVTLGNYI